MDYLHQHHAGRQAAYHNPLTTGSDLNVGAEQLMLETFCSLQNLGL